MDGFLVLGLSVTAGPVVGVLVIEAFSAQTHIGAAGYAAGGLTVPGVVIALGLRRRV